MWYLRRKGAACSNCRSWSRLCGERSACGAPSKKYHEIAEFAATVITREEATTNMYEDENVHPCMHHTCRRKQRKLRTNWFKEYALPIHMSATSELFVKQWSITCETLCKDLPSPPHISFCTKYKNWHEDLVEMSITPHLCKDKILKNALGCSTMN